MNDEQILELLRNLTADSGNSELLRTMSERITLETIVEKINLLPPKRREKFLLWLVKICRKTERQKRSNPS